MKKFQIGGVPEHFNLPWYLTLSAKEYTKEGINLRWKDYPSGTGAMCKALREKEIDMAVILTEGIVRDIIDGNDCKITHSKGANSIPEKDALNPIHDPEFKKLRDAALSLLESSEDAPRQYYYVNLMKLVKTYTSKTSFGELALLTDKRRKAKLETR